MKVNYAIVAFEDVPTGLEKINILHVCAYENEPQPDDFTSLFKELDTDPEFGLAGRMGKDVFLMNANVELMNYIKALMGDSLISDSEIIESSTGEWIEASHVDPGTALNSGSAWHDINSK
jgi:hypothetical protein